MKTLAMRWNGITPLIMHADTLVDPLHPLKKAMERITAKRTNKTDEDHESIAQIEMAAALYYDDDLGVYLPDDNVLKCLIEAARLTKEGKNVERGVRIAETKLPLKFAGGPLDREQLCKSQAHRYRKPVVISRQRVIRTRPIFRDWAIDVTLHFDPQVVKQADLLVNWARIAGDMVGMGNRRIGKGGQFGRFDVEVLK